MATLITRDSIQTINGTWYREPSALDPNGLGYVVCNKHRKAIAVSVSDLYTSVADTIENALKKCRGCLEEIEISTTRFPEGAEL